MNDFQPASIDNIARGEAKHKFNHELGIALADCMDFNKEAKKPRKIILEVVLTPKDEARTDIDITASAWTKLQKDKPIGDTILMNQDGAPFVNNARQMDIADALANGEIESYDAKTGEVISND